MKTLKKLSCLFLALCMVLALPMQVFAETYDLANGNITITTDADDQYVSQAGGVTNEKQTTATVITGTNVTSANTDPAITVDTSGGKTAEFTLSGVDITSAGTGIDVDASSAVITVEGTNSVTATESNSSGTYCGEAAIHVSSGSLTVTGGADDTLNASVEKKNADSRSQTAAIGSDGYEDLSGSITVTGDLTVNASADGSGSGIGSGFYGNITDTGSISIEGGTVNACSRVGTGIGSDMNMNGTISISGGTVNASSDEDIAIGTQNTLNGTIQISGGTVVAAGGSGNNVSVGIGSGYDSNGTIQITGGTVTATGGESSAGIGGSMWNDYNPNISITGGTVTAIGGENAAGIGGGGNKALGGSITIGGDATVIAQAGSNTRAYAPNAIGNGGTNDEPYPYGTVTVSGDAQVYLANNGTLLDGAATNGNVTASTEDALTIRDKVLAEQNKPEDPAPQPTPTPQPEPVEEAAAQPSFWDIISWKIQQAEEGSELTIEAGDITYITRHVIELARSRNITLIIKWKGGGDITISPKDDIDLSAWKVDLKDLV